MRPSEDFPKTFPRFVAEDLKGNLVTEKIFEGKISAVILWTTDSEPCIKILENLPKNLPPNCQVIGLIGDKNFDAEVAKKFSVIPQLKVNDDFAPLLAKIKVVPTAIFIDRHGNLIEPPQFVPNAKFILRELNLICEKNLNTVQTFFW